MACGIELIGERIRALGQAVFGSYASYAKMSAVAEAKGVPMAEEMIVDLVRGHEIVLRTARKLLPVVEEAADASTKDLLTQRMLAHEKTVWLLRPLIR